MRPILLEDQDRSRWDAAEIAEAHQLVRAAQSRRTRGRYVLQAAIASQHARAPTFAATGWPQILELYDALLVAWPSPVVALNRAVAVAVALALALAVAVAVAVAVAMVHGPAALTVIEQLERDGRLAGYRYLPSAKAEILRRLGRIGAARDQYAAAVRFADNDAEREFLRRQGTRRRTRAEPPLARGTVSYPRAQTEHDHAARCGAEKALRFAAR